VKAKKAIKRLQHIEALLGTVIDKFDTGQLRVHELLDTARSSVSSATEVLVVNPGRKPVANADEPHRQKQSDAGRKSAAAADSNGAKRNGTSTGSRRSRKTA
jgi:hypothetical protein